MSAPTLAKLVAFGLFLTIGFAAIPLMLRVFLWGQRRIGNEAVPMVRFLAEHQSGVVLAVGREAKLWLEARLRGPSRGVLSANVGMLIEDVRRRPSVEISMTATGP